MNINFEYDKVKASGRLEVYTAKKIEKLVNKYDFIVRSDVFFSNEKTSDPDTGKICKIRLSVPGPRLFAESSRGTFDQSVSEVVSELERQLKKRKAKMNTH